MHQLSRSVTDCYSTKHITLFMLVHSLNGCSNHRGLQIVMVMTVPALCPCFTQPLTHCTFMVYLKHINDQLTPQSPPHPLLALPQYKTTVFMDFSERENPPPSLPPSLLVAPLHHLLHSSPSTHAFPSSPASLSRQISFQVSSFRRRSNVREMLMTHQVLLCSRFGYYVSHLWYEVK